LSIKFFDQSSSKGGLNLNPSTLTKVGVERFVQFMLQAATPDPQSLGFKPGYSRHQSISIGLIALVTVENYENYKILTSPKKKEAEAARRRLAAPNPRTSLLIPLRKREKEGE
jgi:hypothetical protein